MKYISKRTEPPNGWAVAVPETGHWVRGISFDGLVDQVHDHLVLNGYPLPDNLKSHVTDLLCARLGPGWCREIDPPGSSASPLPSAPSLPARGTAVRGGRPGNLSVKDLYRGFGQLWRWYRAKRPLNNKAEALARAQICVQCAYNQAHNPCPVCSSMYRLIGRLTASRKHPLYERLQVCGICRCCNKTQTQIPLELLRRFPDQRYPAHCWKRDVPMDSKKIPSAKSL